VFASLLIGLQSNSCTGFHCLRLNLAPARNRTHTQTHTETLWTLRSTGRHAHIHTHKWVFLWGGRYSRWRNYFGYVETWQPYQDACTLTSVATTKKSAKFSQSEQTETSISLSCIIAACVFVHLHLAQNQWLMCHVNRFWFAAQSQEQPRR